MSKPKPFAYLKGMIAAPDAPIMDNPARLYCPQCRAAGQEHCADPGYCGNLRPMRPMPEEPPAGAFGPAQPPNPPSAPRRGAKGRLRTPVLALDRSQGRQTLTGRWQAENPAQSNVPSHVRALPERIMGRRSELRPLPDGEEMSYDWFFQNIGAELP